KALTLAEAAGLRAKALSMRAGDQTPWNQLRERMQRAETLAEGGLADPVLVARLQALRVELKQDEADRRVVARLEEIYLNQGIERDGQVIIYSGGGYAAYGAAFRDYGIQLPM